MRISRIVHAACAAMTLAACADAIVIRHDRDDARYRVLGEGHACVVTLGGGTGTLVAPRWILTAAHVADGLSVFDREIAIDGKTRKIDLVLFHPGWDEARRDSPESGVDMALVRLDEPVDWIEPAGIYESDDEVGQRVVVVGRGSTGDGESGITGDDGLLRGAENIVESVRWDNWIRFVFDRPTDANALDLEGISGPGDSGGPALIERGGEWFVAGVSAANDSQGGKVCGYGSHEYYTRVSAQAGWLRETMSSEMETPSAASSQIHDIVASGWPEGEAAALAREFFEAFNSTGSEELTDFETRRRGSNDDRGRPIRERVDSIVELRGRFGSLTPEAISFGEDGGAIVRTRSTEGRGQLLTFTFVPGEDASTFVAVRIAVGG